MMIFRAGRFAHSGLYDHEIVSIDAHCCLLDVQVGVTLTRSFLSSEQYHCGARCP